MVMKHSDVRSLQIKNENEGNEYERSSEVDEHWKRKQRLG